MRHTKNEDKVRRSSGIQLTWQADSKRKLAGQVTTTAWDQFACTSVDELISAAKNAKSAKHAYDFDDIGNRKTSSERGTNVTSAANNLNQYTQLIRTFEHFFLWDPAEKVATRPLVWLVRRSLGEGGQRGISVAYYTHDGNKNVSVRFIR